VTATAIEPVASGMDTNFQLVAIDQVQLARAQDELISWAERAQKAVQLEKAAEEEVLERAKEAHWARAPHERRIKQLARRLTFYGKIESALRDGYVVIPNFPLTLFAIRTKAGSPHGSQRDGTWARPQSGQILPEGAGEYKNPVPLLETASETRKASHNPEKTYEQTVSWPSDWQDEIEFPIALAKPVLMQRTATALAKRLFDEIGVASDSVSSGYTGDPIICGRIRNPRAGRPAISFFLGWYFDPARL
jgi:hypothetical protein